MSARAASRPVCRPAAGMARSVSMQLVVANDTGAFAPLEEHTQAARLADTSCGSRADDIFGALISPPASFSPSEVEVQPAAGLLDLRVVADDVDVEDVRRVRLGLEPVDVVLVVEMVEQLARA